MTSPTRHPETTTMTAMALANGPKRKIKREGGSDPGVFGRLRAAKQSFAAKDDFSQCDSHPLRRVVH